MTIKLHVFPLSPRAFKVMWAANHLGIVFEPVPVDFSKGAHRTPDFVGLNPNMRMPVLEDDGYVLWESNAILQYLAALKPDSGLLPNDTKARMQIVKWQFWDSAHWDPALRHFRLRELREETVPARRAFGQRNRAGRGNVRAARASAGWRVAGASVCSRRHADLGRFFPWRDELHRRAREISARALSWHPALGGRSEIAAIVAED